MAVLSEQDRQDCSSEFQRAESRDRNPIDGTKPDVKILIDSLDDYLNTNGSAMNQSIPSAQRSMFTTAQKARALIYIVNKRYLQG